MRSYLASFFTDQNLPPATKFVYQNLFAYDLALLFITSITALVHFI